MKDVLLIFDLNGTLFSRLTKKSELLMAQENPFLLRKEPDFKGISKAKVYKRPYFQELIDALSSREELNHISIAVW